MLQPDKQNIYEESGYLVLRLGKMLQGSGLQISNLSELNPMKCIGYYTTEVFTYAKPAISCQKYTISHQLDCELIYAQQVWSLQMTTCCCRIDSLKRPCFGNSLLSSLIILDFNLIMRSSNFILFSNCADASRIPHSLTSFHSISLL